MVWTLSLCRHLTTGPWGEGSQSYVHAQTSPTLPRCGGGRSSVTDGAPEMLRPTGHSLPCLSRHHHPPDGSPVTKALPILQENDPFSSDWLFLFLPPVPPVSTGTLSHAGWYVPMP